MPIESGVAGKVNFILRVFAMICAMVPKISAAVNYVFAWQNEDYRDQRLEHLKYFVHFCYCMGFGVFVYTCWLNMMPDAKIGQAQDIIGAIILFALLACVTLHITAMAQRDIYEESRTKLRKIATALVIFADMFWFTLFVTPILKVVFGIFSIVVLYKMCLA